ncbi:35519_t:CDS:2, partial [Racocetra persica]
SNLTSIDDPTSIINLNIGAALIYSYLYDAKKEHKYIQYGLHVADYVCVLGWNDLIQKDVYNHMIELILDTEEIREKNPEFLHMLHDANLLNIFEEIIPRLLLPGKLSSFIKKYLNEKEMRISNEYKSLYTLTRTFIDS